MNVPDSSLQRLMQGRTTLIVAHRSSTMQLASRMMTLENGQLRATDLQR